MQQCRAGPDSQRPFVCPPAGTNRLYRTGLYLSFLLIHSQAWLGGKQSAHGCWLTERVEEREGEPTSVTTPLKEWAAGPQLSATPQQKPFVETLVQMFAEEKTDRRKQGLGILKGKEAHFQPGSYRLREDKKNSQN